MNKKSKLEERKKQQRQFLKKIYTVFKKTRVSEATGILSFVREMSKEDVEDLAGTFGCRLHAFSKLVDLKHPDIKQIYDGQLVGNKIGSFSKDAVDYFNLINHAKRMNFSPSFLTALKQTICSHAYFRRLDISLESPIKNQLYTRFLSKENREAVRKTKRFQYINIANLQKRGKPYWAQQSDNFFDYVRNCNRFERDIQEATLRKKHFLDLGLKGMAGEIDKSIKELTNCSVTDVYCGFNKININVAAIILAKMHGYKYYQDGSNYLIGASLDIFEGYDFFDNARKAETELSNKVQYDPILYTLDEVADKASVEIMDLVKYLEEFPELGRRPVFDYYRVLIPTISYTNCNQSPSFHFKKPDGTKAQFSDIEESHKAFTEILMEHEYITGILLGEKDGEHYFISYFI